MTRIQITAMVSLIALVWGVWLLVAGATLGLEHFAPFSGTVSVVAVVLMVFHLWAWKWIVFRRWLVPQPSVIGTWRVELLSDFTAPDAQKPIQPVIAYFVVRQTFLMISVRTFTRESLSYSLTAQLKPSEDGQWMLNATFMNTPKIAVRDKSQIHYGAVLLHLGGNPCSQFTGHYWTDRKTRGDIKTIDKREKLADGFEEAETLFSSD